ncbi:MAG: cell surface protein [Bacteroides sp.]|nr:cell surface protein [Bacteroides sp.]MCM1086440.1 cell surface protein [Bacteroides sp.]
MKKFANVYGLWLIGAVLLLCACHREIPMVSLGIDDTYAVPRMKALTLHPEFSGDRYLWHRIDSTGRDTLVSTERDFIFCSEKPGVFNFRLHIEDPVNPYTHEVSITVWEEEVAYSPYIAKVYEYCPAPGQFVNMMPEYEKGDTYADMLKKAEESVAGSNDVMISLGAFGGYVTFGFDHSVVNVPGQYDFKIYGNAFYAAENPNPSNPDAGGSSEPGIVMVSFDRNQNGLPDDEWYELAGSEYSKPETKHRYSITYHRPETPHTPVPHPTLPGISDTAYIRFTDSEGKTGYVPRNAFHNQDYFPQWTTAQTLTFTGTRLADNAVDESGEGNFYVLYPYDWGYVDNHPNEAENKSSFNIEWAVDENGNPVHLPCIDFVRVYTGVSQSCGWLGETSTELSKAEDLHIEKNSK